jgi:aspartyl-tRNA(Asn)/glutamyl-tRNA(Gln) amidotransferase subunit B
MPELPDQRVNRFVDEWGIPQFQARVIVQSGLDLSDFYEETCKIYADPQAAANWIVTYLLKSLNFEGLSVSESKVSPETFVELLNLVDEGVISVRFAKELIKEYTATGESPRKLVEVKNLGMIPEDELEDVVSLTLKENPQAVTDYLKGKKKAVEFLLGQVLRKVHARAKTNTVREIILEKLDSKEMPR